MKNLKLDVNELSASLNDEPVSVANVSTPAVRRQKSVRRITGNILKKMVLGRERIFHHEIIEVGQVERLTHVFHLNERDQELLNAHGVDDILPSIKKNKRNDFEVFARSEGNKFELADGSRRRKACILGNAALLAWVCDDLTDADMVYLSDAGNKHKQASVYERGIKMVRWLNDGQYTSAADIARELKIDRRTVNRCLHAAKLPKWLICAFKTPNDMSVDSAGQLYDMFTKNLLDEELLKRRVDGCKIIWNSQKYSGAEITRMLLQPVITDKETKIKPRWIGKNQIKVSVTKTGMRYDLPTLNDEKQKQLDEFIKALISK